MFEYKARVHRVIDGDTVDVVVDLGFKVAVNVRLRLLGIDTPEMRGAEKAEGRWWKNYVEIWLKDNGPEFIVRTKKTGKYGRWLGTISSGDKVLNDAIHNMACIRGVKVSYEF